MKKTSWYLLPFLLVFFVHAPLAAARPTTGDCYIQNFASDVTFRTNAAADVAETITVDCGTEPGKHGIFRVLPESFKLRPDGEEPLTLVSLRSIEDERAIPYNYGATYDSGNQTITWKIGDPAVLISGVHVYVIKYSMENIVQHPQGKDLVAWNINGNFWDLETDALTATFHFPAAITPDKATIQLFAGPFGATDTTGATSSWKEENGQQVLTVTATHALKKEEGVTMYASVPANTFSAYSISWQRRYGGWFWLLLIPVAFFLLLRYWRKYGRDPKIKGAQVVYYDPPGGLHPMELGLLDSWGVMQNSYITATIVDFATRGYLTITEIPKKGLLGSRDWLLTRLAKQDELLPYEADLLERLDLGQKDATKLISSLKNTFYLQIPPITELANQRIKEQELLDPANGAHSTKLVILGVLVIVAGIVVTVLLSGATPPTVWSWRGFAISLIFTGVLTAFFAVLMPRRTEKGAELEYQLKGFQVYMAKAEKYREQFYEREGIFEKLLPYAILFGLTEEWIKAMRSLYAEKNQMGYVPGWYFAAGGLSGLSGMDTFAQHMESISNQMSAATANPGSSGGSGGGFSGGGGGGGGGGSW